VDEVVKAMGMSGISRSQVSLLCAEIDQRVKAFLDRPIEGGWPYQWIDATYVKVRQAGRIVSVAVIVAVGVNTDGRREVLGMDTGPSEPETFWTAFLRQLARRGLRGVKLVVSDAHEDIKAAVAKTFTATWPAAASRQAALQQPHRAADRRDQAAHRCRRHLPQRGSHHPPRRRHPARAERRMGCPACSLHHAGKHRSRQR
jgi:hypothetical protein